MNARALIDLDAGTIVATIDIAASPERIFRALTDPNEVPLWWGSDLTYRTQRWSADLRVGGRWRGEGINSDGRPFSVEGTFLRIERPHLIEQTWEPDWDAGHITTIVYRIEATTAGARVTVHHTGFGDRAESQRGHGEGWERVLGWLAAHVA